MIAEDRLNPTKTLVIVDGYKDIEALADGRVATGDWRFALSGGPVIPRFRPFLHELHAPIAEIPIMTFLAAREAGAPLALLPAIVLSGSQHGYLFHDPKRPITELSQLIGKRVAIRAFSVTTAAWIRDILQTEHGVDPADIEWVTFEPPHVASFINPPNVVRAPPGTTAASLLRDGGVAAAVLRQLGTDDHFLPLLPEAPVAAWMACDGTVQINHMMCVTKDFAAENADAVDTFMTAIAASASASAERSFHIGRAAVDHSLDRAIACALRQGIIQHPVRPDELYRGNGLDQH